MGLESTPGNRKDLGSRTSSAMEKATDSVDEEMRRRAELSGEAEPIVGAAEELKAETNSAIASLEARTRELREAGESLDRLNAEISRKYGGDEQKLS